MTTTPTRRIAIADEKITKKQIDQAIAEGKTHAKFTNKGVQRRMLKAQEKVRREQELRENKTKQYNKAVKAAKGTRPVGGGIGLLQPVGDGKVHAIEGSAHFINKDGKHIPVSSEVAEEVAMVFEAEDDDEIDITGAPGPEYRYLQDGEVPLEPGFRMVGPFEGMGVVVKIDEWLPINTAPQDGTLIQLRGKWKATDPSDPVVIEGQYSSGGHTEGWESEKGVWFCPDAWKPIQVHEHTGMGMLAADYDKADAAEFGLTEYKVSPEAIEATTKLSEHILNYDVSKMYPNKMPGFDLSSDPDVYGNAAIPVTITSIASDGIHPVVGAVANRQVFDADVGGDDELLLKSSELTDSILAEHSLTPFEPESPGNRAQMFGSQLSSKPKGEIDFILEKVKLRDNQVFINLYGDSKNYKPLPAVGECVRPDGIVMAVRIFNLSPVPTGDDLAALQMVSQEMDTIYYGPQGAMVTKITEAEE